MPFRCPLPRDLQLLILEYNSPPAFDKGMVSYLEWMWELLKRDCASCDTITLEVYPVPIYSPDDRYTPRPHSCDPQFGPWEVFITMKMEIVYKDGTPIPLVQYRLHWEHWGKAFCTLDAGFATEGEDFQTIDLLEYAPRSVVKMPRCIISPNSIKFDDLREDVSDYWDFHVSELMSGPVCFRNAHLLSEV